MRCHVFASFVTILLAVIALSVARAGDGPQNVLVVVNAASPESLEIGNLYRRARSIPYRQLLTLNTTTKYAIPYQIYLDDIETPIRQYLQSQQLEDEIACIVLTRGVPQQVLIENGRSTAGLLATLNMKKGDKPAYARVQNPFYNTSFAAAPRPAASQGMYLVTVLNGYHLQDITQLIEQGVAADGTAPAGQFLLQTSTNFPSTLYTKPSDLLTAHALNVGIVNAPPANGDLLMGFFSGGIYSGLTADAVTGCTFRPGAIVDIAQNFSAAANNFDESLPPILLPLGAFVRAGASGVHGVIGDAGNNAFPLTANASTLLDHYISGFSLAESYYAALPSLNWQNVVIGDPLCTPYARRPAVTIETGTDRFLRGVAPIRITAASQTLGATISRLDLYLDDRFVQTLYQPKHTKIVLRIGDYYVTYEMPRDASLPTLLEGLADAVNNDTELAGADGVHAVVPPNTDTLQLLANTAGEAGNNIPVSFPVVGDKTTALQVTARLDNDVLTGGGRAPTAAQTTLSFIGRQIKPGDQVVLKIQQETLTYTVRDEKTGISDLLDALVNLVETSPTLHSAKGVHAERGEDGMPFIILTARTPGAQGNAIACQLTVHPAAGSPLHGYPDTPTFLSGGGGSAASLTIHFALGEATVHALYLLKAGELIDGYHRLRVIAYDGSPAQVQGVGDCALNIRNTATPPRVTLPDKLAPACRETTIAVTAQPTVNRVDLFIDGQLVGSSTTAPFAIHIPLTNLGRGTHDLWAEGFDAVGNRYVTAPTPLQVQVPPEVLSISPDHAVLAGAITHRVVGSGFEPGCTVTLAGVPAHSIKFITPNMLEVVSDAGPACQGSVEVTNPDHTVSTQTAHFEYYRPTVAKIQVTPPQDQLAPGGKGQFTAKCFDQYEQPITAAVTWETTAGAITATGLFTAPEVPGKCTITAECPECRQVAEIPVTVGTEELRDGWLRHWLITGPYADADHTGIDTPLLEEATQAPSHGDSAKGCTWQSVSAAKDTDYINLCDYLTPNINVVAYGHVYLYAPALTLCTLVFGSDDGIRIWLNGSVIFSLRIHRSAGPNQNTQPIVLRKGWNRLLVKNDQETGEWGFFMRLTSQDGKPLTGIKYQLDKPVEGK